jgi:hypothetical protein
MLVCVTILPEKLKPSKCMQLPLAGRTRVERRKRIRRWLLASRVLLTLEVAEMVTAVNQVLKTLCTVPT